MTVVSLGLFGMEEASVEIEDPFGTDHNCLDMQAFTLTIARDAGQLARRAGKRLMKVQPTENHSTSDLAHVSTKSLQSVQ